MRFSSAWRVYFGMRIAADRFPSEKKALTGAS